MFTRETAEALKEFKVTEAKNNLTYQAKLHPLFKCDTKKVVIHRGSNQPHVLFIGEAPGFTENKIGQPFVGPSGKVIDKWADTLGCYVAFVNTVPLIPLNEQGKIRPPTDKEIDHFRPYTKYLIKMLNPKYIICVGKSASRFLQTTFTLKQWDLWDGIPVGYIYHPAYYLRNGQEGTNDFEDLMRNSNTFLLTTKLV